ncbi:unnamed protein product [Amoebophrya sp. A120]|nr:unnamed protein product [Amoebophrya sp. A120]|eukprot:GSA120T00003632001.1
MVRLQPGNKPGAAASGGGAREKEQKNSDLTGNTMRIQTARGKVYLFGVRLFQNDWTGTVITGLILGIFVAKCCGYFGWSAPGSDEAYYTLACLFLIYGMLLAADLQKSIGVDVVLLACLSVAFLIKHSDSILHPSSNFEVNWVRPVAFTVFGIPIQSFGICMAAAFLVCHELAEREFSVNKIECAAGPLLVAATVGGLFGAKVHYVILNAHIDDAAFFAPGLVWQGGALMGAACVIAYVKSFSTEIVHRVLDVSAPLLPLGHAIGKIGCFVSGDGCYGPHSSYYFAMSFPHGRLPTKRPVHPTPIYEMILSGLVFHYLWTRRHVALWFKGDQTTLMFLLTSVTRFITEIWRDHNHDGQAEPLWPWNQQQMICAWVFVLSCVTRLLIRWQAFVETSKANAPLVPGENKGEEGGKNANESNARQTVNTGGTTSKKKR